MITRLQFLGIGSAMTLSSSLTTSFQLQKPHNPTPPLPPPPLTRKYHEPPKNVDYATNPSVFGQILNGTLPCRTYDESTQLLAFQDKSPRAKLHALIIPKRYIKNVYSLSREDAPLLRQMNEMGLDLIRKHQHQAFVDKDYILCYHIPPFNSVDHLHLHVLAPASEMNVLWKMKYLCGMRWCVDGMEVVERLEGGESLVPYWNWE